MAVVVPVASFWTIGAVRFSNLPWDWLRALGTVLVAVAVLGILAVVDGLWRSIGLVLALVLVVGLWFLLIPASNEREWQVPVARISTADFSEDGNSVTVRNVRNFRYRTREDYDVRYDDRTYSLDQLTGVRLYMSYWGQDSMAHTFLSFEFEDAAPLALSIEIRPEVGESYHPLRGLFKQYEIIYILGDERDLVRLRSICRGEETYLYRTTATPQQARALLVDVLERVNELAEKPAYYGTIGANCTTSLVMHANKILENDIPFSGRLLFNGFSDKLAYEGGNMETEGLSFLDLKAACSINGIDGEGDDHEDFSTRIREHVQRGIEARRQAESAG